jgi:hypothetical protein
LFQEGFTTFVSWSQDLGKAALAEATITDSSGNLIEHALLTNPTMSISNHQEIIMSEMLTWQARQVPHLMKGFHTDLKVSHAFPIMFGIFDADIYMCCACISVETMAICYVPICQSDNNMANDNDRPE